ncbi:MAG: endo alpha-1,4 polygalactosaminidase [bacterium]|nr:endo alpha-1,4 polygalactosaminidase [bacterium]
MASLFALYFASVPLVAGKGDISRWIVYYGDKLKPEDLSGIDAAFLDPDVISVQGWPKGKTRYFGYLSVGEAENFRWYWPMVKGKNYLVEKNPIWKESTLVDIRSEEWQQLLLDKVIPRILAKGYSGLILDTVDTAVYLEDTQAEKYAGSKRALVSFVKKIRKKFPGILIVPNNGLEMLNGMEGDVYGVMVEDLYTNYDFGEKVSRRTPENLMLAKEERLDEFRARTGKPVFNVLYETSNKSELARYAIERSEEKGYDWYLTKVDLMSLGMTPGSVNEQ